MKTNYFSNCKTLEEVKRLYKKLALQYHPDRPGESVVIMQRILVTSYPIGLNRCVEAKLAVFICDFPLLFIICFQRNKRDTPWQCPLSPR